MWPEEVLRPLQTLQLLAVPRFEGSPSLLENRLVFASIPGFAVLGGYNLLTDLPVEVGC